MQNKTFWHDVFRSKASDEVSWYKPHLELSLDMITRCGARKEARIMDVGGGDSTLVDDLVQRGYENVAVLDIAASAIERAKKRLGDAGRTVTWIADDILKFSPDEGSVDIWHDRALFHFFLEENAKREYLVRARTAVGNGGHLILATFAPDGPERCSGLPTMRYSAESLTREVADHFTLVESQNETHMTPQGKVQPFVFCRFRRR